MGEILSQFGGNQRWSGGYLRQWKQSRRVAFTRAFDPPRRAYTRRLKELLGFIDSSKTIMTREMMEFLFEIRQQVESDLRGVSEYAILLDEHPQKR